MNSKNKLVTIISIVIILILMTIGLSYAYFTANLTGQEDATSINVTGGTMNIIYNGGPNINIVNTIPSDNPATTKTFTVTGNNTTDLPMNYQVSLVIVSNDFSEEALKYKLVSTNTDNNGTVVSSISNFTNIGTGFKTIELGTGEFISPTNGNKVHTYNLEIYFSNTSYNQNNDQGKEFKAYIKVSPPFQPLSLNKVIVAQGGGKTIIEAKGNPNYSQISTALDTGLYASVDEYGISYYYRGNKELLNNNLIFGGFQWKIVRVNGDNSVRIIYNGTEAQFNQNGMMNIEGNNTQIGNSPWEENYNDAKYVGYMYGGASGVASTNRVEATTNQTSGVVKTFIDNWYLANISGKPFEAKIADNLFCNDRQLQSEVGGTSTGPGYGTNETNYAAYYRLQTTKNPTLKCAQKNDRFTTEDAIGNKALTYPVGLLTVDEAAMAGLVTQINNKENYLHSNYNWWTISPFFYGNWAMILWMIEENGYPNDGYSDYNNVSIRPVLSLSDETTVTGEGSTTNPFKVVD